MACDQTILELLSCYVDGEASPQEAARAEAHLDTCAECREMVKEWRHGIEMLDWTYSRALPENTAEIGFDAPAPKPEREQSRWSFPMPYLRGLAVAAVLACIAVIGFTTYQKMSTLPMLGRTMATVGEAKTVLVARGIRLTIEPDTEVSRLGDKAVRLVQGTIHAEVSSVRGFRVHTRLFEITDEGTKFEVHSDSRTDRVTVTEGRVTVRKGMGEYHVRAGETLTCTGDKLHNDTNLSPSEGGSSTPSTSHGGVSVGFLAVIILSLFYLVFWVKMLFDALRRTFKDSGTKIAWVLVIFFGQWLGAVMYYYVVYAKDHPRKHLRFPLVGRRGDKRVVLSGNVSAILVIFFILAAVAIKRSTSYWNLPIFLATSVVTWLVIAASIQSSLKGPIEKLYDLDGDFNPGVRFWYLLVGRKGNRRVIQWWNVLLASVISAAAFGYGITLLHRQSSLSTVITLMIGAGFGILFVVACVVQIRSYPLDVLTDLETGERPNQEVRNRRYPLPFLVGRRNGGRVIMWANIIMLSVAVTGFFSRYVLDHPGSVDIGRLLPIALRVFFGLIAVLVLYSEIVALKKPSRLDDDDYDSNAPRRLTMFTLFAREGGRRVIVWRNVPITVFGYAALCILWGGIARVIVPMNHADGFPAGIVIFLAAGLGFIDRALRIPLEQLPSLDDDQPSRRRALRLTLVVRMGDRRFIMWWNVLGMAVTFSLCWSVLLAAVAFYVLYVGVGDSKMTYLAVHGAWRTDLLYFGLFAVVMISAINIVRLLRVPLDELPSVDENVRRRGEFDFVRREGAHELTNLDDDARRRRPRPLVLIGRRGDRRVAQWGNVVAAVAVSAIFIGLGSTLGSLLFRKAMLFLGMVFATLLVITGVVQALLYPLSMLTDLEGETPVPQVRKKPYPLFMLAARKNGKRVIMWRNIGALSAIAVMLGSSLAPLALQSTQGTNHGPWLLVVMAGAVLGLAALMVMYALLAPLDKLPSVDDDDHPNE